MEIVIQFYVNIMKLLYSVGDIFQGTILVGGFNKVWSLAEEGGRITWGGFDPDPRVRHTFWELIVGGSIVELAYLFNQGTVQ